jgi:hypothetical protein
MVIAAHVPTPQKGARGASDSSEDSPPGGTSSRRAERKGRKRAPPRRLGVMAPLLVGRAM